MSLGQLFVSIGASTDNFQKEMKGVSKQVQQTGKQISDHGKTMTKWITGPIAGAGAAVAGLTKKFASHGDKIAKTSQKLGMSTDAYQELEYAMGQVGVEEKAMERGLGRLNQRMGRAVEGNENLQEAFGNLGYSMQEIEELDTDEAFMDIINRLHEMDDAQQQSALASEIFGTKMARDLMPAINEGGEEIEKLREEAHDMGIVMDEEAVKASEEFEDAMDNLSRSFKGIFQQLAQELIPVLVDDLIPTIEEKVVPMLADFGERVANLAKRFFELDPTIQKIIVGGAGLLAALGPVLIIVGKLITVFGTVAGAIAGLNPVVLGVVAVVGGLIYILQDLWRNNEEFRERVIEIWESVRDFFENVFQQIKNIFFTVLEAIKGFWETWGQDILDFATDIFKNIWQTIELVMEAIYEVIQVIAGMIKGFWENWGGTIKSIWQTLWDAISGIVESVLGTIRSTIESAFDIIHGVFDVFIGLLTGDWERMWDGMQSIVRGAANGIIGLVNGVIGAVEAMVNAVGDAINRMPSFDIPSWVPGIGGSEFGLPNVPEANLPRIPKLHDGGQFKVRGPGTEALALLEHGEVVTPAGDASGGGQTIIVELDGRQIARAVGEPLMDEMRVKTGLKI